MWPWFLRNFSSFFLLLFLFLFFIFERRKASFAEMELSTFRDGPYWLCVWRFNRKFMEIIDRFLLFLQFQVKFSSFTAHFFDCFSKCGEHKTSDAKASYRQHLTMISCLFNNLWAINAKWTDWHEMISHSSVYFRKKKKSMTKSIEFNRIRSKWQEFCQHLPKLVKIYQKVGNTAKFSQCSSKFNELARIGKWFCKNLRKCFKI